MIEAVVQENSRKARKKIRLMLLVRFGPKASLHGIPPWHAAAVKSVVVTGNPADPSAQLLAGWLTSRLDITVPVEKAEGKYIVAVGIEFEDGRTVQMTNEGYKLLMRRPGQLDTIQPFPQRTTGDMLAEELRRLDEDDVYAEVAARLVKLRSKK